MRINYVLLDFENVRPKSVASLIEDHFKIIIFVGESQSKLPFEFVVGLQRLGERVEYVKIRGNGKNALDFHIAFYLGQLATQDSSAFFHVISQDTGFDPLIEHLRSRKICAVRSPSIESILPFKAAKLKSSQERAEVYIEKFKNPKATRPASAKTLARSIASCLGNKLSEPEVIEIVELLKVMGFLKIVDNKVAYD